jgi:hypothetical protein
MTLMPCPECQRQISTAAAACPQCGHPLKQYCWPLGYLDARELRVMRRWGAVLCVVLLAVGLGLNYLLIRRTQPLPQPAQALAPPVNVASS